jgi:predicted nucleotidyltransferase
LTSDQAEVLRIVAEWAARFPCISAIYVFGSFARNDRSPSDLDIAVAYTEEELNALVHEGYTNVNLSSPDLEASLKQVISAPVAWTGIKVLGEDYDHVAWDAIHSGREVGSCGKAKMIWTEPKPKP